MFSSTLELKLYVFSFLNKTKDIHSMSLASKQDNDAMQQSCRDKIKLTYNYTLNEEVNSVSYYKKLKMERERLIDFLVLQEIYEHDQKKWNIFLSQIITTPTIVHTLLNEDTLKTRLNVAQLKKSYDASIDLIFTKADDKEKQEPQEFSRKLIILFCIKELIGKHPNDMYKFLKSISPVQQKNIFLSAMDVENNQIKLKLHLKLEVFRAFRLLKTLSSFCFVNAEELLTILLKNAPEVVQFDFSETCNISLLHSAAISHRPNLVKLLLAAKVDVNLAQTYTFLSNELSLTRCEPPLMVAITLTCFQQHLFKRGKETIQLLLAAGARTDLATCLEDAPEMSIQEFCQRALDHSTISTDDKPSLSQECLDLLKFIRDYHEQRAELSNPFKI